MPFRNQLEQGRSKLIVNPTDEVLLTSWDGEEIVINPQSEEEYPDWLARHIHQRLACKGVQLKNAAEQSCTICGKNFETKRELGAHTLIHRRK